MRLFGHTTNLGSLVASKGGRRASWTFADQAASSLTNFTMSFMVLRTLELEAFGAFSIAYITYILSLNFGQVVYGEPLVIRYANADAAEWKAAARRSTGAAAGLGSLVAVALAGVALFLPNVAIRQALLTLAVVLPGLLVQDAWRYAFFARGTPAHALIIDLVWGILQVAAVGGIILTGHSSVGTFVLAWGAMGVLAGIVGSIIARVIPDPRASWRWLVEHRRLIPNFLGEMALARGANQLVIFFIAATAGLAALGSLNGASVLLGPINVIYLGSTAFMVAEASRVRIQRPSAFRPMVAGMAIALPVLAIALGTALLLLPMHIGERILDDWGEIRPFLIPVMLKYAAHGMLHGWRSGLRALAAAKQGLRAQWIMAPIVITCGAVGSLAWGGLGGAWGLAIAGVAGSIAWWRQFENEYRRSLSAHPSTTTGQT